MKKRNFIRSFKIFLFSIFFFFKFPFFVFSKVKKKNVKVLFNPIFLDFILSKNHPEQPDRIRYIINKLTIKKLDFLIENIELKKKTNLIYWVKKIHSIEHINSIKKNFLSGHKVAIAAVETSLKAMDIVMQKNKISKIFCATRPPGHHALNTGSHEGFCFYNHLAILVKYAQQKYKLKKILIVDWDYHHGNSTEYFFYNDPQILFFSTHDFNAYPRTGSPKKKGEGLGYGLNVNVHLPCGSGDLDILNAFRTKLIPETIKFKPELVLISAGFDGKKGDPLGCFNISNSGFKELTKIVIEISNRFSNGRLISILEGGYNLSENAAAVVSHIEILNNFN